MSVKPGQAQSVVLCGHNASLTPEHATTPILRAALVVASTVAIAAVGLTLYVVAVHDPDDGANIGGGIGIIGSGLAIAAVLTCVSARGRRRAVQVGASMCAAILLLVAFSFVSFIRPFE